MKAVRRAKKKWFRGVVCGSGVLLVCLAVWIIAGLPEKIRFVRIRSKVIEAVADVEAIAVESASWVADQGQTTNRTIHVVARDGSHMKRFQPGDFYVDGYESGKKGFSYYPDWKIATTWDAKGGGGWLFRLLLYDRLEEQHGWLLWLNPLLRMTVEESSQGGRLSIRCPTTNFPGRKPRILACCDSIRLDRNCRPACVRIETFAGDKIIRWCEWVIKEYHTNRNDVALTYPFSEGTKILNDDVGQVIQSDEKAGCRINLFESCRDRNHKLLVGLHWRDDRDDHLNWNLSHEMTLRDADANADITDRYEQYGVYCGWPPADGVRLYCFKPKAATTSGVHRLDIDVHGNKSRISADGKRSIFSFVTNADFRFTNIHVRESWIPVFPEHF